MRPSLHQVASALSDGPAFPNEAALDQQAVWIREWNASLPQDTSTPKKASRHEEGLARRAA